ELRLRLQVGWQVHALADRHRLDQTARKDGKAVQGQRYRAEQTLLFEIGVVAVEGQQVVQIQCRLRLLQQRTVGIAGRQVGVAQRGVWRDLVEEHIDAGLRHVVGLVGRDGGDPRPADLREV